MGYNPFKYGEMTNSTGQKIEFYECAIRGDTAPVIAVCHDLKLAEYTNFYELDDMVADHGEYEPIFVEGKLFHGQFEA